MVKIYSNAPIFSSKNFSFSYYIRYIDLSPFAYLHTIFVYVMKQVSNFIFLHVDIKLSQYCLLKFYSFPIALCWQPYQNSIEGFPGGTVVENLPANAGHTDSSPGLGRSHMPRSNQAREPQLLSLRVWSLCSATRAAVIVRGPRTAMKSGPRSPQLEKALARNEDPTQLKINK